MKQEFGSIELIENFLSYFKFKINGQEKIG